MQAAPGFAGDDLLLQRVQGSVAYSTSEKGTAVAIVATQLIPPDDYAITGAKSLASLKLPDSSIVSLGEETRVRTGAFLTGKSGPGSTIAIESGAVHFNIVHPSGGQANYTFVTPTSSVAVRGTEGMIETEGQADSISVIDGKDNDVVVTTKDGQRFHLTANRTLRLERSAHGKIHSQVYNGYRAHGFGQFHKIMEANAARRARAKALNKPHLRPNGKPPHKHPEANGKPQEKQHPHPTDKQKHNQK